MDPVSPIEQLSRLLRKKNTSGTKSNATTATTKRRELNTASHSSEIPLSTIKQQLVTQLEQLTDEQQQGPESFQLLASQLLRWKFGDDAMTDTRFQHIAKRVGEQLWEHNASRRDALALIDDLLEKNHS